MSVTEIMIVMTQILPIPKYDTNIPYYQVSYPHFTVYMVNVPWPVILIDLKKMGSVHDNILHIAFLKVFGISSNSFPCKRECEMILVSCRSEQA